MRTWFLSLCLVLWLHPIARTADDSGYRGDYELQDRNFPEKFKSQFRSNDIHRQRIDAETVKASSQIVVGIVQSENSIRMAPEAYGALIVSTGTFDLYIATGLCDSCWRKVRTAQ